MKTIMLCLNQLGIGGIETAALNQTIQFVKRNYRVLIVAADGIYREKFEKEGALFINLKFSTRDQDISPKVKKVVKVMEKYNVEQVHIHHPACINVVFFACILKSIPYIAYLHSSIEGTYELYKQASSAYEILLPLYFSYAEKIVAIQEKTKLENMKKFNIESEKYIIVKNSIDFNKFKIEGNSIPEKIERFLIISRIETEKEKSICNAIELFRSYYKSNPNAKLTIVGDGNIKEKIEREIEDIEEVTRMLGERNDIAEIISEHDIVVALDRCILEAIAMKKIAVISGYEEIKEIITEKNIKKAADNNFNGDNLNTISIEEMTKKIKFLDKEAIKNIVEMNYKYAYENLNSDKNIYIIEESKKVNKDFNKIDVIESIIKLLEIIGKDIHYADKIYKECKESQSFFEGQIKNRDIEINGLKNENERIRNENEKLKKELEEIHESKLWKIKSILKK